MANEVRIRVLAIADESLRSALKPLEDSVGSAQKKTKTGLDGIDRATRTSAGRRMTEEERVAKAAERARDREAKAAEKSADRQAKAAAKKAAAELAAVEKLESEKRKKAEQTERYLSSVRNNSLRAEQALRQRDSGEQAAFRRRMVADFGGRAVSNIQRTLGAAGRFGKDVAQGAGYEFSVGGSMARSVELQKRSIDLSNQGYIPSEGKQRIDPKEVEARIKAAADATGFDRLSAASGLNKFVGKSGELDMGLKMLPELGKLARASGAELDDLADAAGDVSNAFKDDKPEDQLRKTQAVMRTLAGQGKIGAVEIKNLATQAAKLTSASGAFGGDAEKNLGFMGALTQMSRATGGSASATQAATSVGAFVNTLKTPARIKQFEAQGINLYDKKTGLYNDPENIVLQALSKTQGDPQKFKKMFANVQGARAVEGAALTYRNARSKALTGGANDTAANEAGLQAVKGEFNRFRKISMSGEEIDESFKRSMGGQDAKSQSFNNKFDDIVEKMGEKLLPALEKLEPVVLRAAESFTKLVTWAAENPGKAITAAIVGSIAKAGLETALRAGLEGAMSRAIGGGGKGGGVGAGGGGMGNLGAGLTIFGASIAITGAGIEIIDSVFKSKEGAAAGVEGAMNDVAGQRATAAAGEATPAALAELEAGKAKIEAELEAARLGATMKGEEGFSWGASALANFATAGSYGTSAGAQEHAMAADDKFYELQEQMAKQTAAIDKMNAKLAGGINAHVTNMPTNTGSLVDPGGRGVGVNNPFFGMIGQ
jgi:hypothetical protein